MKHLLSAVAIASLMFVGGCGGGGVDFGGATPDEGDSTPVSSTLISVQTPFALSDGISGDKPKVQRLGDGTLLVVYGDSPDGVGLVYDVKAAEERPARDIFIKTCKPNATKACNKIGDWSAAVNGGWQRSTYYNRDLQVSGST